MQATKILLLLAFFAPAFAMAQSGYMPPANDDDEQAFIDPKFAMRKNEIGFMCGEFLPNQIQGVTELMPLCGMRFGFKTAHATFFEPMFLGGNSHSQTYYLSSLTLRMDMQLHDIIASFYGGADVHYMTRPLLNSQGVIADQTDIFFGGHIGTSLWAKISKYVYLRTDLQFNLNPGTSLYIGAGFVLRLGSDSVDPNAPSSFQPPPPPPSDS